ncbi:67 kDa myosin-cross-reactive antigen family protein [Beauveria brongniartii RCEF 3172]|uniref:67 kDa myosin-cross-reactive antigen family protein n=1 Tax=Beauveria brongniartii RCEF 3172 TaxID=1081107 RepID=A0A162LYU1_9HYPO|nr:67 kDa myosin-cross-reactive antigen family protein [Beauveria brongniartii RCEF 3172]
MSSLSGLSAPQGWISYLVLTVIGLLVYAVVCSAFRFRRIGKTRAQYGFYDRASLGHMTNEQAHHIVKQLASLEAPTFFDLALRMALLRTFAIEDIAKLLVASSDLNRQQHAPKRYEDTAAIFTSFIKFAPNSEYLHKAVARMNYLHSPYQKNGRITNRDLLYVLWASMAEPIRFMRQYEWRELTDMEVAALGTLWKYIGDMMQIDYKAELGQDQWRDGIDFVEHVTEWAYRYEDVAMKRLPDAQKLVDVLLDLLLTSYPAVVRPMAYQGVLVLMGDRLGHAFSLPEPSIFYTALVHSLLFIRKSVVRYIMLPRLFTVEYLSDPDLQSGRLHNQHYLKEPWYTRVSLWTRWGPEALLVRATGGQIPGDGGKEMLPEGFLFTDLGPRPKMGKGIEDTQRWEQVVKTTVSPSACPFGMK